MKQECYDESRAPSAREIQKQSELAASAFAELEVEDSLVPLSAVATTSSIGVGAVRSSGGPTGSGNVGQAQAKGKSKKGKAIENPLVEACTCRAQTAKLFIEVGKLLQKAVETGEKVLTVNALEVHRGNQGAVDADPSLALLRSRLELAKLALDSEGGQPGKDKSFDLYESALKDPYMKDLSSTLLMESSACHTLGYAKHMRTVILELRPGCSVCSVNFCEMNFNTLDYVNGGNGGMIFQRKKQLNNNLFSNVQ